MTPIRPVRIAAGAVLTLAVTLGLPGHAGEGNVVNDPMVFVPPVALPPTPVQIGTASETGGPLTAEAEAEITEAAVRDFAQAQALCAQVPDPSYRIDCLADQLDQLARKLPPTPEFAEARQIVQNTAQKLERVARRNASPSKRPARLRQDTPANPRRSSRPIVPVATERLPAANLEASAALKEAETLLLRASQQSDRRKLAFAQVAEAVGSSTILLRST